MQLEYSDIIEKFYLLPLELGVENTPKSFKKLQEIISEEICKYPGWTERVEDILFCFHSGLVSIPGVLDKLTSTTPEDLKKMLFKIYEHIKKRWESSVKE